MKPEAIRRTGAALLAAGAIALAAGPGAGALRIDRWAGSLQLQWQEQWPLWAQQFHLVPVHPAVIEPVASVPGQPEVQP